MAVELGVWMGEISSSKSSNSTPASDTASITGARCCTEKVTLSVKNLQPTLDRGLYVHELQASN